MLLCFAACVEILCALELLHPSDVFYSSVLQLCLATQSVQIAIKWLRQRFSKSNSSAVLSCESDCVLQVTAGRIALELTHHGCDLSVKTCTKHLCFFW